MITIGKTIYSILSSTTGVTSIVGTSIYPLIIPEKGTLPCIIFKRGFNNNYTKDGLNDSDSTIDLTILATDYEKAIDISTAVFNCLNMYRGEANGIHIYAIHLVGGDEDYTEGAFIQKLNFEVKSSLV